MKVNFTACCIITPLNELMPNKVTAKMPYMLIYLNYKTYLFVERLYAS